MPHVVIADALADGVRSVARVLGAGQGDQFGLATVLGMPPWKVKRAGSQAGGWSEPGLRQALGVVADLNADVKGAAADPAYALEAAVRRIARRPRRALSCQPNLGRRQHQPASWPGRNAG